MTALWPSTCRNRCATTVNNLAAVRSPSLDPGAAGDSLVNSGRSTRGSNTISALVPTFQQYVHRIITHPGAATSFTNLETFTQNGRINLTTMS